MVNVFTDNMVDSGDGWGDDIDVTDEDLKEVEKSAAAELMHQVKVGHVPELVPKSKVSCIH